MSDPQSYEEAQKELEQLLQDLQVPKVDMDDLTAKVERAKALIDWSRTKLRSTEDQLNKLFEE